MEGSASSISEVDVVKKAQKNVSSSPEEQLTAEEQFENAIESIEITQDEYSEKLFELTNAYWDIQEKFTN